MRAAHRGGESRRSGLMKYLVMVQGTQADYDAMRGKASAHSPA
ncbi:hypothetical protein QFZ43_002868 [Streptomyces afghaniensis]|nr:hypothetical protein [Streptomyces afghaniensis]